MNKEIEIKKMLAVAIVIAMACASMIIVSPNNTVTAEDSAKPLADRSTDYPGNINKVAWHEDGSYALGILSGTDHIYKYTRNTMAWTSEKDMASGNIFADIKYSANFDSFYIVGDDNAGQTMAWSYALGVLNDLVAPATTNARFEGLGLADMNGMVNFAFLAVGIDNIASTPYAAWFEEGVGWTEVTTGWTGEDEALYDVVWDQSITTPIWYAVGTNFSSANGIIYQFENPGTTIPAYYTTNMTDMASLTSIDWRDGFADSGLLGGSNNGVEPANIYAFTDLSGPQPLINSTYLITDISWHPDDNMAMVVGYYGGLGGVVYHYHPDAPDPIIKMTEGIGYPDFNGVDVKGWTSPSSGLIVGNTGAVGSYLSAENSDTYLTVNAAFPHIYDIDMWETSDAGQASTLNTQVDIDDTYTFYTEVNYTIGGVDELFDIGNVNNTFIDLTAWYDEGTEALMPLSDDTHRTKKFVARFYEGVAGTAGVAGTMIYPTASPGTDEITFDSVGCSGPFGIDDRYAVWINVTFGRQMRAAAGPFGGASTNIFDTGNSFNGADSWNFQMEVYDNDFPGASNTTYEEFGTFMYTNISITGNPSVNAPPGSVNEFMAPNSFITYSANTPYYVNVSIPDLTSGGDSIAATEVNISLVGAFPAGFDYNPYTEINASWGTFGSPFAAAGSERMVWGNLSEVNYLIDPTDNGTTAYGPWGSDFNGYGATEIEWWVSVPGATPEGIYQATITFKIGYW